MNEQPTIVMPRYRCHKEVYALKIRNVVPQDVPGDPQDSSALLVPEDGRYAPFRVSAEYMKRHNPQPGGWFVVYADGYQRFSPAAAFESGYTLME